MTLTEQRQAVKAELERAKRAHRPTAVLQRKYQVLTAAIMAEQIEAQREASKKAPPPEAFRLCSEADPDLWITFCRLNNRPPDPSQVWTTFDVVLALLKKHLAWLLAGESPSGLSH